MLSKTFYSPRELAEELAVGYRKILDEINVGRLVAYRIGGSDEGRGARIRVSRADAEQWLKGHCQASPEIAPASTPASAAAAVEAFRL